MFVYSCYDTSLGLHPPHGVASSREEERTSTSPSPRSVSSHNPVRNRPQSLGTFGRYLLYIPCVIIWVVSEFIANHKFLTAPWFPAGCRWSSLRGTCVCDSGEHKLIRIGHIRWGSGWEKIDSNHIPSENYRRPVLEVEVKSSVSLVGGQCK